MRILSLLAVVLAMAFPAASFAQETDRIKAELKKRLPEAPVDSVRKVPYSNLYEVVVGGEIIYTDDKASFVLLGPIVDLKTKENVTEARLRQVNAVKFDALPFENAIKIVRGNGSRKVAMFADPNCGYCKRFERDLLGVSDITVYVFLYPILSPDSVEKSKAVWCSADPGKTWLDLMTRDKPVQGEGKCTNPVEQNLALGQSKRVNGTPTMFFENGERAPGALPLAEFEKRLAANSATKAAKLN
jgi:thiol:disulfide interchange protein DsbC